MPDESVRIHPRLPLDVARRAHDDPRSASAYRVDGNLTLRRIAFENLQRLRKPINQQGPEDVPFAKDRSFCGLVPLLPARPVVHGLRSTSCLEIPGARRADAAM